MKFEYRKLSIALITIYSACMIFTAYELFQLPNTLVFESQVISATAIKSASPVFIRLYFIVGFTLIVGMTALVTSLNKKSSEVIYVEKKKSSETNIDDNIDEEANSHTQDLDVIREIANKEND